MATVSWKGYESLRARLAALQDPDASPLMRNWERIITEGNRRGVLSGLDGNNVPMPTLQYRGAAKPPPRTNRRGSKFGARPSGSFLEGNNLTTRQYQELTGPRLAPRLTNSRVIRNLTTGHGRDPAQRSRWFAVGRWVNVFSARGVEFLPVHFEGGRAGRGAGFLMPRYDLRPVRPEDVELARQELVKWATAMVEFAKNG